MASLLPPAADVPAVRRRRILAVDDEVLLLRAYKRMLIAHHDVTTSLGAAHALAELEKDSGFDAILCDLQMPGMSGMEFHAQVCARWPLLASRFVFVTGGAFSSEAHRFLQETALAAITKPFELSELLALIERRVT